MNKSVKKIKYRIEYLATLFLSYLARMLPYRFCLILSDVLGDIFFYVIRMRRDVSLDNLKKSFPEKSPAEIKRICRGAYRNFAKTFIDFARFPSFKKKKIFNVVNFHNTDLIDKALAGGRGVILLAGHFGSWELIGAALAHKGYPLSFLVGEQHNYLVDNLMNKYRRMHNIGIIKMGVAARGVIKVLKNNECVAFLSDQDAGKDGVIVNFFGRKASTPGGAGAFSYKLQSPIIMVFPIRNKKGKIDLYLEKVDLSGLPDDKDTAIYEITQRYTSLLESYIRKFPDHWFWMHRRWKSVEDKSCPCIQ